MKRVLKFHIEPGRPTIALRHQLFAHAGLDPAGRACIWLEIGPGPGSGTVREFQIFGTGHEVSLDWTFEATFLDGPFVWHVYSREAEELLVASEASV